MAPTWDVPVLFVIRLIHNSRPLAYPTVYVTMDPTVQPASSVMFIRENISTEVKRVEFNGFGY